jgi:hypothetical protein
MNKWINAFGIIYVNEEGNEIRVANERGIPVLYEGIDELS